MSGASSSNSGSPSARRCALYIPGHTVHFIQARHGWEERRPRLPGRLVAVEGNLVVVQLARRERRYRNHEPDRLRAAGERAGGEVLVQEGLSLLWIPSEGGASLFCIAAADEPWRDCLVEEDEAEPPSTQELVERVLERGGGYFRPLDPSPD